MMCECFCTDREPAKALRKYGNTEIDEFRSSDFERTDASKYQDSWSPSSIFIVSYEVLDEILRKSLVRQCVNISDGRKRVCHKFSCREILW